jgi:hypothetical protein
MTSNLFNNEIFRLLDSDHRITSIELSDLIALRDKCHPDQQYLYNADEVHKILDLNLAYKHIEKIRNWNSIMIGAILL